MRTIALMIGAFLLVISAGCSNPCEEIAEVGCQFAGEQSEECAKVRKHAENPSAEDKRACRVVLELVDKLDENPE